MKEFDVCAAMVDRVGLIAHYAGCLFIKSERRLCEISGQYLDTTLVQACRKLSLVERLPQTDLGRSAVRSADVAGDMRVGFLQQRREKMTANETSGSGQENALGLVGRARAARLDVRRQQDVAGQVRDAVRSSVKVQQRRKVADDRRRIDRRDREVRPDLVADAAGEAGGVARKAAAIEEDFV